jgi:hypothetical protein
MPVAKFHVHQGQYDHERLERLGNAVQGALEAVLEIPQEDYYRVFYELPPQRFVHTPAFLGLRYSKDLVMLELTFISGRPKETRLALLKEINRRAVEEAGISQDDMVVLIYELPGENVSFGRGLAQRAHISNVTAS